MRDFMWEMDWAEPTYGAQMGKARIRVHPKSACKGEACCLHNPSDHPLAKAPLNWRADRGLMERICEHGVGHPDPDDLAFKKRTMWDYDRYAFDVHGCCGCCSAPRGGEDGGDPARS